MEIINHTSKRYYSKNRVLAIKVSKIEYEMLKFVSKKLNKKMSDLIRIGFLGKN